MTRNPLPRRGYRPREVAPPERPGPEHVALICAAASEQAWPELALESLLDRIRRSDP